MIAAVTDEHRRATMKTLRVAFLSAFVLELAATLATALVAVEVGLRLLGGHLDYRTALLVLLLTPEAYLPLRAAGAQFHASAEGTAAAQQALAILAAPAAAAPSPPARRRRRADLDLRLDTVTLHDVTVTYPGRPRPALDGVFLTIRPGDRLTLTGPSGAGKSTLLAVLLRLTEPDRGLITAGGTGVALIDPAVWRAQLAWVPQAPHLFTGTVAGNIALGRPGASAAAVIRAARQAGLDDFAAGLPRGYDTPVGERGLRLSAGQRQKVALARAFLREAPVLLLDEPAAHLDPLSAAEISQALARLPEGQTVITVTHRDDLAGLSGRILRLEDGRLRPATGRLPALAPPPAGQAPAVPAALAVTSW